MNVRTDVLRFTEKVGQGTTRSQRINQQGSTVGGTPWQYTGSYTKDPDGESEERYVLTFGDITISYMCWDCNEGYGERQEINGPGFEFSASMDRHEKQRALLALYNGLSDLAKTDGVPLPQFAEALASGAYAGCSVLQECVGVGTA